MRARVRCVALLLGALAAGAPAMAQPVPADAGWVEQPAAELHGLDKVAAKVTPIRLRVGQSAAYGSLTITLRGCRVRPPDQPRDATAFLDIVDSRNGAPPFHGWIFANEPSLNIFQHPVYDIRLIGCAG
jgi:hypothetical protein